MTWRWPHFSVDEMRCKGAARGLCSCGGSYDLDPAFLDKLEAVRVACGFSFVITSGFRCPEYNAKVSATGLTGPHTIGAADVRAYGSRAVQIVYVALTHGMTGIGVAQKGPHDRRFIHLDALGAPHPRPWIWTY